MPDTSQTRSEAASPRRREESRKRGQVATSNDLSTGLILLFMLLLLSYVSSDFGQALVNTFVGDLPAAVSQRELSLDQGVTLGRASAAFLIGNVFILLLGASVLGIGAYVSQVGLQLSPDALSPKSSRLSPISGAKKIFSLRGLMRTATAVLKFVAITVSIASVCYARRSSLLRPSPDLTTAVAAAWDFCMFAAMMAALGMIVVGAFDFAFQRWQHEEELKMTRQEQKDETKETEGDPQIKARIRKLQGEAAQLRTLNDVPSADVVITNPSHFAVAIKYERGTMAAPKVLAKGADLMAKRIKRRARDAGVPVVERKSIARALYASTDVGSEIPAALYRAVAEILAHVYGLSNR